MDKRKFYIITLGCKINQYESEAIRESWLDLGLEEAETVKKADIVLINRKFKKKENCLKAKRSY